MRRQGGPALSELVMATERGLAASALRWERLRRLAEHLHPRDREDEPEEGEEEPGIERHPTAARPSPPRASSPCARNVATRRLVMLSVTFLAAPAEEVAATATIEVPIARRMSRWKTRREHRHDHETTAEAEQRARAPPASIETPNSTRDSSMMVTTQALH